MAGPELKKNNNTQIKNFFLILSLDILFHLIFLSKLVLIFFLISSFNILFYLIFISDLILIILIVITQFWVIPQNSLLKKIKTKKIK
jgi:hypothetical protein